MNTRQKPNKSSLIARFANLGCERIALLLIAALLLSGCGFRLRGQAQLPPQMAVTYIKTTGSSGAPPSALIDLLTQVLRNNGVRVTSDPAEATATLEILEQSIRRRTIATGRSGESREYTLTYTVQYRVALADGSTLIPADTLSVFRDLLYSETDVLGKAEGEQIALADLMTDVARSILLRLEVLARKA